MPNQKPEDSLDTPMRSRSLGVALGVTELLFIAGILLLAIGCWLLFGGPWTVFVVGAVLVVTSWLMQFAE